MWHTCENCESLVNSKKIRTCFHCKKDFCNNCYIPCDENAHTNGHHYHCVRCRFICCECKKEVLHKTTCLFCKDNFCSSCTHYCDDAKRCFNCHKLRESFRILVCNDCQKKLMTL